MSIQSQLDSLKKELEDLKWLSTSGYEQLKNLGKGGFGQAILARRKFDGKMVVLKKVCLQGLSPHEHELALKEAQVLREFRFIWDHHIVKYIDSFQESGCLYTVMEYADGGDLRGQIRMARELFSERKIWQFFEQIALGIHEIHSQNILHRDLKPDNIFLTRGGDVKIGDFGIAKVLDSSSQLCHTGIGTMCYVAPEILSGRPYDKKADIWSLGCVLYELCTLRRAFESPAASLSGSYQPISSQYSQDLRNLVDWMLAIEPDRRPTIKQVLSAFPERSVTVYKVNTRGVVDRVIVRCNDRMPMSEFRARAGITSEWMIQADRNPRAATVFGDCGIVGSVTVKEGPTPSNLLVSIRHCG